MAQELKIMVGIPASGKSTWAEREKERLEAEGKRCIIVSRDAIRKSFLSPGDDYFSAETETFQEFVDTINANLWDGVDVVIADATHVSAKSRHKLLRHIKPPEGTKLTFEIMEVDLDTAIERNAARTGYARVPNSALQSMRRGFSYPNAEEYPLYEQNFETIEVNVHRKKGQ